MSIPFLRAQVPLRCGFDKAYEALFSEDPDAKERFNHAIRDPAPRTEKPLSEKSQSLPIYTIPVVFHILHQGGPENISDAQIQDALFILNRDFNKQNPDTTAIVPVFQTLAADCQVEFRLATVDPNGNCTTGITRHYDPLADWSIATSSYKYTWNRSSYLNIYVVRTLPPGVAAYTYLPGTVSPMADAVVILNNYVGTVGTGYPPGSRSLTHEVGHWFNLQHTWGSTNQPGVACGDDGVGDTPVTKGFGFCDLNHADQCNAGIQENIQNYMEYAFCSNMFTLGQKSRMHTCLTSNQVGRNNLWSQGNLQFTGVFNLPSPCSPKADFAGLRPTICLGDTAHFIDYSYNGTVSSWAWTSPNTVSSSSLQNAALIFNQTGPVTVKLKVSNNQGVDSITKNALVVLPGAFSGTTNIVQDFEPFSFPNPNWLVSVPQNGSPFQTNTLSATSGSTSLWVNNFFDNPSEPVSLYTPQFLFQPFYPSQLSFYYAYAKKSSGSNDALNVYGSTDCGLNWIKIFGRNGNALPTVPGPVNTAFFASSTEYSFVSLSLADFADEALVLKFEFDPDDNGPGNNIFIEDILVSGVSGVTEMDFFKDVTLYPNPFSDEISVMGIEDNQSLKIELIDGRGGVVFFEANPSGGKVYLPTELNEGLYLVRLSSEQGQKTWKLVKTTK